MDLEHYSVKTEIYEGPLDVLLNLIEKRKLFINDISLAKVADDYIAHVQSLPALPIGDTAQFVLIASTLIFIKSKSLLPTIELTEEEEQSIGDLERRLELRKRYKELEVHIKKRFGKDMLFAALPRKQQRVVFAPDHRTDLKTILERMKLVLAAVPKPEKIAKAVVKKVVSLEEMIMNLTERMNTALKMSFREFSAHGTGRKEDKVTVIVSFLAMLELVKEGLIAVRQDKQFQDIEMESASVGVPRY